MQSSEDAGKSTAQTTPSAIAKHTFGRTYIDEVNCTSLLYNVVCSVCRRCFCDFALVQTTKPRALHVPGPVHKATITTCKAKPTENCLGRDNGCLSVTRPRSCVYGNDHDMESKTKENCTGSDNEALSVHVPGHVCKATITTWKAKPKENCTGRNNEALSVTYPRSCLNGNDNDMESQTKENCSGNDNDGLSVTCPKSCVNGKDNDMEKPKNKTK